MLSGISVLWHQFLRWMMLSRNGISVQISLFCIGNVVDFLACLVYFYDCKRQKVEKADQEVEKEPKLSYYVSDCVVNWIKSNAKSTKTNSENDLKPQLIPWLIAKWTILVRMKAHHSTTKLNSSSFNVLQKITSFSFWINHLLCKWRQAKGSCMNLELRAEVSEQDYNHEHHLKIYFLCSTSEL